MIEVSTVLMGLCVVSALLIFICIMLSARVNKLEKSHGTSKSFNYKDDIDTFNKPVPRREFNKLQTDFELLQIQVKSLREEFEALTIDMGVRFFREPKRIRVQR